MTKELELLVEEWRVRPGVTDAYRICADELAATLAKTQEGGDGTDSVYWRQAYAEISRVPLSRIEGSLFEAVRQRSEELRAAALTAQQKAPEGEGVVLCCECGKPTMHMGTLCFHCSKPDSAAPDYADDVAQPLAFEAYDGLLMPDSDWFASVVCDARNKWTEIHEDNWLETDENHPDNWIGAYIRDALIAVNQSESAAPGGDDDDDAKAALLKEIDRIEGEAQFYDWSQGTILVKVREAIDRAALSAPKQVGVVPDFPHDATDLELVQQFVHTCRSMKPVGQWSGERLCVAIERLINGPRAFISETDMPQYREESGRVGFTRQNTSPQAAPVPVEAEGLSDSNGGVPVAVVGPGGYPNWLVSWLESAAYRTLPQGTKLYTAPPPEQPAVELEEFRPAVIAWKAGHMPDRCGCDDMESREIRIKCDALLALIDGAKAGKGEGHG